MLLLLPVAVRTHLRGLPRPKKTITAVRIHLELSLGFPQTANTGNQLNKSGSSDPGCTPQHFQPQPDMPTTIVRLGLEVRFGIRSVSFGTKLR